MANDLHVSQFPNLIVNFTSKKKIYLTRFILLQIKKRLPAFYQFLGSNHK